MVHRYARVTTERERLTPLRNPAVALLVGSLVCTLGVAAITIQTVGTAIAAQAPVAPTAKICGERWRDAKAAGTLQAGQTWPQYLRLCRSETGATVPGPQSTDATPANPKPVGTDLAAGVATSETATDTAAILSTTKICGQKWKQAKAEGTVPAGQTWPQYLKLCNTIAKSGSTPPAGATTAGGATDTVPKAAAVPAPEAPSTASAVEAMVAAPAIAETQAKAQPAAIPPAGKVSNTDAKTGLETATPPAANALAKPASQASLIAKACGVKWRAAKTAGTVAADATWNGYLKSCRAELAATDATVEPIALADPALASVTQPKTTQAGVIKDIDPATSADQGNSVIASVKAGDQNPAAGTPKKPVAKSAEKKTTSPSAAKPQTAAQVASLTALNGRRKTCGAAWQEAKASGNTTPEQTWPKFWSSCNAKLKAQGG
jgi:hypothetical protein